MEKTRERQEEKGEERVGGEYHSRGRPLFMFLLIYWIHGHDFLKGFIL